MTQFYQLKPPGASGEPRERLRPLIYALQPTSGGPVKIGTTENLTVRVAQLECHYGLPLAVLATLPGGPAEERELHRRFAHLRLGRTEQFQPAPDLMAFLGRPLLVGANPAAVEVMPGYSSGKRTVLTIKGTDEWRRWLEGLGEYLRTPTSTIVDHALVRYAKEVGYAREAPKR